jgi:hypothetical protein
MASREERRARNEVTFRAGNEAIVKNIGPPAEDEYLDLICECGSEDCLEAIYLTPGEYEQIRDSPVRFAIMVGHEDEDEIIVGEFDRYTVVEKTGAGRDLIIDRDPRS